MRQLKAIDVLCVCIIANIFLTGYVPGAGAGIITFPVLLIGIVIVTPVVIEIYERLRRRTPNNSFSSTISRYFVNLLLTFIFILLVIVSVFVVWIAIQGVQGIAKLWS